MKIMIYTFCRKGDKNMLTVEQQVLELRESIRRNIREEFKFQPKLWEGLEETRNCFTYAFNIHDGKVEKDIIANYGEIVGKSISNRCVTVNEVYDITVEMLEKLCLDFKECQFETEVPKGYFKVAWYVSQKDIHWLRRDDDGTWSHKQGWYQVPTNVDLDGNLILNPKMAKIELAEGDQLIGIRYFLISRNYQG